MVETVPPIHSPLIQKGTREFERQQRILRKILGNILLIYFQLFLPAQAQFFRFGICPFAEFHD